MDIIDIWSEGFRRAISNIPPASIAFWLKLGLLVGIPTLVCYLSVVQGAPTLGMVYVWGLVGVFFAFLVPTKYMVPEEPTLRIALILFSAVLLWFCPRQLGMLLGREEFNAQRIAQRIYLIVGVLLVLQLFMKAP